MSPAVANYRRGLRDVSHELLWWGYEAARSEINASTTEDDITSAIYFAMRNKLNEPELSSSYNRYEPTPEWRIYGRGRTGKSCQRIDIAVVFTESRPREKFSFEAKRLRTKGHPISAYVGAEGMGCYLNEEYAWEDPDAAMIGYVQSHDAARWHAELQTSYVKGGLNPLRCASDPSQALQKVVLHGKLSNEWQSEHVRPTSGNVLLYHIFLDCT